MNNDQPCHLFSVRQWLVAVHPSLSSHTDSKASSCVASLSLSNKAFAKVAKKDERAVKLWKVITVGVKFKLNINDALEETADCGNADTAAIQDIRDLQPGELSDQELGTKY